MVIKTIGGGENKKFGSNAYIFLLDLKMLIKTIKCQSDNDLITMHLKSLNQREFRVQYYLS